MKRYLSLLASLSLCFMLSVVFAQMQKPRLDMGSEVILTGDKVLPLWLYSNQWGVRHPFEGSGVAGVISGDYQMVQRNHFSLKVGASVVAGENFTKAFFHQGYLKGNWHFIDFSIGKEAFSPVVIDDDLTSGSFLCSSNARPVPRLSLGIYHYLPLKLTRNWIEIRGGISQGVVDEHNGSKGHRDVLLHEKFAYARLGRFAIQPYFGLVHSALFGGYGNDGEKIKVDYWATFLGSGSSRVGGGEETNVAGAHAGLYDFGLFFPYHHWKGQLYIQKPFEDGSGMRMDRQFLKDHVIGLVVKTDRQQLISGLSLEWIRTDWQSGEGTPDPIDPENGELVFIRDIADIEAFVLNRFGPGYESVQSEDDLYDFLSQQWNQGHRFGGRDDYLNNWMYYSGWSYKGLSMGTPLFQGSPLFSVISPGWQANNSVFFLNNRIRAVHLGMKGSICNIDYRLKCTATRNYGSYAEEYLDRYSWIESADNLFRKPKDQFYSYLSLSVPVAKKKNLTALMQLGYDGGDLYRSGGVLIGLHWHPVD